MTEDLSGDYLPKNERSEDSVRWMVKNERQRGFTSDKERRNEVTEDLSGRILPKNERSEDSVRWMVKNERSEDLPPTN